MAIFVCRHVAGATVENEGMEFVPLQTPLGAVYQAFATRELAGAVWYFYGSGENVFLRSDTALTPRQRARIAGQRVVIYQTWGDYDGATLHAATFPWDDRVITYDPSSVTARGAGDTGERE